MAPRKDDNMIIASQPGVTRTSSPASRPTMFELPKDISFLGIQGPSLPSSNSDPCDVVCQRMSNSLQHMKQRAESILKRVEREKLEGKFPLVYESCLSALRAEMSRMLGQAELLLEDAKVEGHSDTKMRKNKRLSVALISAIQYLDTLESAMTFSSRERLEEKLLTVLDSIASKCGDDLEDESLNVCVSSWQAPSLAFDFRVGSPCNKVIDDSADEPLALPLEVDVKPIIEFTADELIEQSSPDADAFCVTIVKCTHEKREYGTRDGIIGEATVKVYIVPLADKQKKKEAVWGLHDDVEKVQVREVRA